MARWLCVTVGLMIANIGFLGIDVGQQVHAADGGINTTPVINSSWDDVLAGITNFEDWGNRRREIRQRYLELIRDSFKPDKPPLDLRVHEDVEVDDSYRRLYINYQVEADERAHAYVGIPLRIDGRLPAVVALHGTTVQGTRQTAGLEGDPDKAFLDHLCRRGYVVISPEHFVSGERIPPEGAYNTIAFHRKHPEWTAVGKFTYEHAIAVDVLETLPEVDTKRIGAMGHSLGGHGAIFLAAYDERIRATVCNCGAPGFRYNPKVLDWARDRWYVYFKPLRSLLLEQRLPNIDFHEIIALIAPRAFMDVSALNDGISLTQRHRVVMLLKVAEVYELLNASNQYAYFVHGWGHSVPYMSRELIYAFLDTHLKP